MTISLINYWRGASFSGPNLIMTRSSRSLGGRISHSKISTAPGKEGKIAGCIGINESLTIWLDTPFNSKNKAVKILPSMLDVQLPFPLEDCCYCFTQFRQKKTNALSVLAVAARRSSVQQRIASYQAAGLDPLIIDHEGLAIWEQSLREKPSQADTPRVIFSLEPDHIAIVIGEGKIFLNSHSLKTSSGLTAEIKSGDILSRIQRILRAELQAKKSSEWVFCGSLARQSENVNLLYNSCKNIWQGALTVHEAPELLLPRALSSRAITRSACNLRQNELIHPAMKEAQKRRSAHMLLISLLAGILLSAFNLAWQVIGTVQFNKAKQAISALCKELAPDMAIPYGREESQLQQIMQKRSADFAPALDMFAQPLSIRLAGIINAGKEADLNFTRLELSFCQALINGTAEDWNYCDLLADYLKTLGYKTEIERREAADDNLVHFSVKGKE